MMGPIGVDFLDAGGGAAGVAATVAPLAEMSCNLCRSASPLHPTQCKSASVNTNPSLSTEPVQNRQDCMLRRLQRKTLDMMLENADRLSQITAAVMEAQWYTHR